MCCFYYGSCTITDTEVLWNEEAYHWENNTAMNYGQSAVRYESIHQWHLLTHNSGTNSELWFKNSDFMPMPIYA